MMARFRYCLKCNAILSHYELGEYCIVHEEAYDVSS